MDIEQIIREYLPDVIHMSLGTSKDNKPWVCEVHYAFDEELNLYFRSTPARRHCQDIASNANIAGNIVKSVGLGEPCKGAVYFEGTAELLGPGPDQQKAFECFKKRFQMGDDILAQTKDPAGNQFYKITVRNWAVFGNYEETGLKKYELSWK